MASAAEASAAPVSVSLEEVARFDALAGRWWDPRGPMRPLHQMNPARIAWIEQRIRARSPDPTGMRLLDIGCGGGLAAEALARLGHDVVGLDAAPAAIDAARAHAAESGLEIDYRVGAPEDLLGGTERFSVITALEIIEHIDDPASFLAMLGELLLPGGLLFLATVNRTARSLLIAKFGAEYVLRLLPVGTHDWRKFVTPAEMARGLRGAGLRLVDQAGLTPAPLRGTWRASGDLAVNYIVAATKG